MRPSRLSFWVALRKLQNPRLHRSLAHEIQLGRSSCRTPTDPETGYSAPWLKSASEFAAARFCRAVLPNNFAKITAETGRAKAATASQFEAPASTAMTPKTTKTTFSASLPSRAVQLSRLRPSAIVHHSSVLAICSPGGERPWVIIWITRNDDYRSQWRRDRRRCCSWRRESRSRRSGLLLTCIDTHLEKSQRTNGLPGCKKLQRTPPSHLCGDCRDGALCGTSGISMCDRAHRPYWPDCSQNWPGIAEGFGSSSHRQPNLQLATVIT